MNLQSIQTHVLDFAKGLVAAMVTAAVVAFLQYFGTHITEIFQIASMTATSTATIMATKK